MRIGRSVIPAVVLGFIFAGSSLKACEMFPVTFEFGVAAKMRDGTILRADIYRPKAEGKFPVLLQRTPYNKSTSSSFGQNAAAHGYVVIVQDVRGRFTSDGDFYTFKNESNDGFDTVEWAAALPYSNGKVGMFGRSYVGATQMLAAIAHPPHLAGICPIVTASNYHENWAYQGGALEQWFDQSWSATLSRDTLDRAVLRSVNALLAVRKLPLTTFPLYNFSDPSGAPASGIPFATSSLAPFYLDWLAHPNYDEYWKSIAIDERYGEITVPALTTAAWYDIFQGGSFRNYAGMKLHAGSDAARKAQHLMVMIGGHAGREQKIGEVDFGPASVVSEDDMILAWYEYLFKGVQNEFAGKLVKIFVMGANVWRGEDEWPLARARNTRYYLHSSGNANSLHGDGSLSLVAPNAESFDHYVYDPSNPVPTTGGPLCCDAVHLKPGPQNQRPVEARDDVQVYSTLPFAADTEVTGQIGLELYAGSSAVNTDFTGKLVDVAPDGTAYNLTEGILRASHRDSMETSTPLVPGQIYKFNIDLWSTSNVFLKGHVLRLEVSSSNFPRFDRNLNTGEDAAHAEKYVPATNSIYHDAAHPSALLLPVIPSP